LAKFLTAYLEDASFKGDVFWNRSRGLARIERKMNVGLLSNMTLTRGIRPRKHRRGF